MRSRYLAAITDKPYWLAGGIPASACVAAYKPIGASNYAASKINLANPGIYTAMDGTAYPDWDALSGWTSETAKSEYLSTGINITGGFSIAIRFSGCAVSGADVGTITGFYQDANSRYLFTPSFSSGHSFQYGTSGSGLFASPRLASGVAILTPKAGYINGIRTHDLSATTWSGTLAHAFPICARRRGDSSTYDGYFQGTVVAISYYYMTLSPYQAAALTIAMNTL